MLSSYSGGIIEKETGIDPEVRDGTSYSVQFSASDNVILIFETSDFRKYGDSDVVTAPPAGGFDCLLTSSTNEELVSCFGTHDQLFAVENMTLPNGLNVFHASMGMTQIEPVGDYKDLEYLLVPGIIYNGAFNLRANASPETLEELQVIIGSLSIY